VNSPSGTPAKSNDDADHFGSPSSSTQSEIADNHVKHISEAVPNHSGSFFESPPRDENHPNGLLQAMIPHHFSAAERKMQEIKPWRSHTRLIRKLLVQLQQQLHQLQPN
jgi:uncharacterized protein (DUF305 family)